MPAHLIISDVESSLPIEQTLPERRRQRCQLARAERRFHRACLALWILAALIVAYTATAVVLTITVLS